MHHAPTPTVMPTAHLRAAVADSAPTIAVAVATTDVQRAICRRVREDVFWEEMRLARRSGPVDEPAGNTEIELLATVNCVHAAVTRIAFRDPADPASALPMEGVFVLDDLADLAVAEVPGTVVLRPYRHTTGLVRALWATAADTMLAAGVTHAVARIAIDTDDLDEARLVHDAMVSKGHVFPGGTVRPRAGARTPQLVTRRLPPWVVAELPDALPPTVGLFCGIGGQVLGAPVHDDEIGAVSLPMIWDLAVAASVLARSGRRG